VTRAVHAVGRRTGRRPGDSGTRQAILDAARREFGERGFRDATMRAIAARAGVNSALVHHFFGSKQDVFKASIQEVLKPEQSLSGVVEPGVDGLGERLVRMFFGVWDSEATQGPMLAVIRSAVTHQEAADVLRDFVSTRLLGRVVTAIRLPDPDVRAKLAGSQLIGMAFMRYVLKMEPLASANVDTLAAWLGPTLQRYLVDDLPRADSTPSPVEVAPKPASRSRHAERSRT
jgi:AcrR family transcriptional regulator